MRPIVRAVLGPKREALILEPRLSGRKQTSERWPGRHTRSCKPPRLIRSRCFLLRNATGSRCCSARHSLAAFWRASCRSRAHATCASGIGRTPCACSSASAPRGSPCPPPLRSALHSFFALCSSAPVTFAAARKGHQLRSDRADRDQNSLQHGSPYSECWFPTGLTPRRPRKVRCPARRLGGVADSSEAPS